MQEGLGGGRCAVPSRHGQKGGRRCDLRNGDLGCWLLLQRDNDRGGVGLRDPEALGEGREGAGGGIAEGTQRCEQHGEEDVNPLIGYFCPTPENVKSAHLRFLLLLEHLAPIPGIAVASRQRIEVHC